jgi:hypothetical protein
MIGVIWLLAVAAPALLGMADLPPVPPRAFLDGTGPSWKTLGEDDFVNVNCDPNTWSWKDGIVHCTGKPVGVARTRRT